MKKHKICKFLLVILAIFLCVAFYELLGICAVSYTHLNVLKTLCLIKYVLEIEANVDNIVSLMITSIDDDRISLKAQVEDALKVLMRQTRKVAFIP